MTSSDILQIIITVGVIQALCDLIANWRVYYNEPYQKALVNLSRSKTKLDQVQKRQVISETATIVSGQSTRSKKKADKSAKKNHVAEYDYKEAVASVARHHTVPSIFTSVIFMILLRILGSELQGKIIAILPFGPPSLIRKLTARGLQFAATAHGVVDLTKIALSSSFQSEESSEVNKSLVENAAQACSFMAIYILASMSIKFYVHKLIAVQPPNDSNGLMSLIDSPSGQAMLRSVGVDPNSLKME
jgi:hypothetical protein